MSDVLVRREGRLGRITLDRPKALNALSLGMVRDIEEALTEFEADAAIACVLIDGEGERAFCAGGDIRAIYDAARAEDWESADRFFYEEYRLNARLGHYPKPLVSVMHGITMGGGIGLGAHAAFRVVTETSTLAMPECGIGFTPDVGGTLLLGRAPGETGVYAVLAGTRLDAADAIACGFADHLVPAASLETLRAGLNRCHDGAAVAEVINGLAAAPEASRLASARTWVDPAFAHDTPEAILEALDAAPEPEARDAAAAIRRNSPGSAKLALRSVRQARADPRLDICLEREYRVVLARIRDPDFVEGVRAAVVDKDRRPQWNPARLEDVTEAEVARHFEACEGDAGLGLVRPEE